MEEKKCPVDRGKLLIGLECCRSHGTDTCHLCPYYGSLNEPADCAGLMEDVLAYIGYLEERLGVTG